MTAPRTREGASLFVGDGELARRCRDFDWAATPLGPVEAWPEALRAVVRASLESPFPINLWCGPDLVLVYNDAYRRVLGAKHPRALGRPGREVWAEIWPTIAPMFDGIRAGGPPTYAEDAEFLMERAGDDAGDAGGESSQAWFTFALSAVRDDAGEVIACLNVVSETTGRVLAERRLVAALEAAERAEARLREVFAQAPAFLAVLRGPEHVFEFVNDAYRGLVGHRPLVGLTVADALPEVRAQGFVALLDRVYATGEPFVGREIEVELAREPGMPPERRHVDFVYQRVTDATGAVSGVVAHGSDVTAQVLARREAELAREAAEHARRAAEDANRAKSQFMATMSHELRTPLNAIGGYAELLAEEIRGPITEPQREDLGRIRRAHRHLMSLINDILNFARLEAGQVEYDLREHPVRALLAELEELLRPQLSSRGLDYRFGACDASLRVLADAEKLRQVLLNLLVNAIKFTEPGGHVEMACEADARHVRIRVRDTGRGIAPAALARIFEPFVQVDRHRTHESQQGVGLGLAISRDLARGMGGTLTAESEPGRGSTFTVELARAADGPGAA